MLRKRYSLPLLVGLGVWLAIAAILLYTNLASAQQTSTASTLSTPSLTAVAGEGAVELSWDSVSGAARYELWMWNSANGWKQLDGGSLTSTTFSHTGLTVGTTYYYWIRAVSASGERSDWSERKEATVAGSVPTATSTSTPPSVVSGLSKPVLTAEAGAGKVELSWEAVTGAVRYVLYTWTSADGWQRLDDGGLTGTSYSQTGVTVSTTYYYAIRAVNTEGETSEWSEYVSLTWGTATPEDTPTPTATTSDPKGLTETITPSFDYVEDSILVTWDPPISGSVSHYTLTRTHEDQSVVITKTIRVEGTSTSYLDSDVEFGFSYDYVVTAFFDAPTATPTATATAIPTAADTYSHSHTYSHSPDTYGNVHTYGHGHTYGHAKEEPPVYRCNLSSLVWHQPSHCFLESSH